MKMKIMCVTVCVLIHCQIVGQPITLHSAKRGLQISRDINISSVDVLNYSRFSDSIDSLADIIRFDNLGRESAGHGPFILSTGLLLIVDSLGQTSLQLETGFLDSLIHLAQSNPSIVARLPDRFVGPHLFRVTSRKKQVISQFFIYGTDDCGRYFKEIEQLFKARKSNKSLVALYKFLVPSGLCEYTGRMKVRWLIE